MASEIKADKITAAGATSDLVLDAPGGQIEFLSELKSTPALSTRPAFMAFSTAGGSYSAGQIINWTNTTLNTGGHFSTSQSRFTAPISGLYNFGAYLLFSGDNGDLRWFRNGTNTGYAFYSFATPSSWAKSVGHLLVYLATGDYIDIRAQATPGTMHSDTINVHQHNQWFGFLLDAWEIAQ